MIELNVTFGKLLSLFDCFLHLISVRIFHHDPMFSDPEMRYPI